MKILSGVVSTLCAGALMGCSPFPQAGTGPPMPLNASQVPASTVEALFASGRSNYEAGRLALAEQYFGHVLSRQPTHPAALNAMAVLYAQTGRAPQALTLFRQAIAMDPKAAHVHNNLGYTLLCMGDFEQAHRELALAFELNPSSAQTRENIERLSREFSRAALADSPKTETTVLIAVSPNIYVLQDRPAESPVAKSATELEGAWLAPALNGARIEISNGVGIRHLAKTTAARLASLGALPVRLTNQPSFQQAKTEIQFSAGQGDKAAALSAKLPVSVNQTASTRLRRDVQVRLVLGHDLAGKAIASWLERGSEARLALAATHPE